MITITIGTDHRIRLTDDETGEPLSASEILDADRDTTVALYGRARALAASLATLTADLKRELEALHRDGEIDPSGRYGGVQLKRSTLRRWDPPRVATVLERLVRDGTVTAARARAVAPTVEVTKPDGRKLNGLVRELAGSAAADELASTANDTVSWSAAIAEPADVDPVAGPAPCAAANDPERG